MYHGLLALLMRSLRQDARRLHNHVFRLAFVAFIYLSLLFSMLTLGPIGAPGLAFFKAIALLNAIFVTCAGIGFFATAITEEKEEEILGLLMMAGLNPLGILLGKSTSRLIQTSLLLAVQFPFMLLAVTLGGITPLQIIAAYVALLAFMTLLANVALVWSTVCERGGSAAGLTALFLGLHTLVSVYAAAISAGLGRLGLSSATWYGSAVMTVLEWLGDSCVYVRLDRIMMTGFNEPVISRQVISNSIGGLVCFVAAWMLFGPAMRRGSMRGASRGLVLRPTTRIRFLSAGRSWGLPLAWKDFQFIAGGYPAAIAKLFAYFLLLFGLYLLDFYWGPAGASLGNVAGGYVVCMVWASAIEACILAARIFHDEVRLQTLSSLMMLPRSIPYLAYSKTLGCLLGLVPSVACLFLGLLLIPDIQLDWLLETSLDPFTWGVLLALTIFLHLVALLSLFVRWGALPLAIVVMAPITMCCPVGQLLFLVAGRPGTRDPAGALAATITVWILMGLVCFVFQMMIAARIQELSSKG